MALCDGARDVGGLRNVGVAHGAERAVEKVEVRTARVCVRIDVARAIRRAHANCVYIDHIMRYACLNHVHA